jgi:hypothetical protein
LSALVNFDRDFDRADPVEQAAQYLCHIDLAYGLHFFISRAMSSDRDVRRRSCSDESGAIRRQSCRKLICTLLSGA